MRNKRVQDKILSLIFILVLFNTVFARKISFFNYFDEVITIISLMYLICNYKSIVRYKRYFNIIKCVITIIILGLIGNMIFSFHSSLIGVYKDILAFCKLPITCISLSYWTKHTNLNSAHKKVIELSKFFCIIIFIFCFISIFFDIGMSYEPRYGIRTYMFLFTHPTFLVYCMVIISCVIFSEKDYKVNDKSFWVYQGMCIFVLLFTFRDKAFAYIILLFFISYLLISNKKMNLKYFLLACCSAFIVSLKKILQYKSFSWSPRGAMYSDGFRLMLKHFPFGTGFCTFNSHLSGEYYSKLYYDVGFDLKPGVNPKDYVDIGDAQWPYYYVQFGVFGFIIFIYILLEVFRDLRHRYSKFTYSLNATYLLFGYMIISSLVESTFINESGATFLLVLYIYLGHNRKNNM